MIERNIFGNVILPKVDNIRIPYMGSKNNIAPALFKKMLEVKPNAKYFYDLFGGGGSMSFHAAQYGLKVIYNEKSTSLFNFINFCLDRVFNKKYSQDGLFPQDFYKFITREEFVKLKDENSIKSQFARICYSFGNNQKNYLYRKELEILKGIAHNIVVFQSEEDKELLYKKTNVNVNISDKKNIYERRLDFYKDIRSCKQLEQLERLEQLQQLEQLQRLQQNNIKTLNLDYKNVIIDTPYDETIVYLDPPYRFTAKYLEDCDFVELDNFFKNLKYTSFLSEYNAPFNSILEVDKRCTFNQKKNNLVKEKLYINRV